MGYQLPGENCTGKKQTFNYWTKIRSIPISPVYNKKVAFSIYCCIQNVLSRRSVPGSFAIYQFVFYFTSKKVRRTFFSKIESGNVFSVVQAKQTNK